MHCVRRNWFIRLRFKLLKFFVKWNVFVCYIYWEFLRFCCFWKRAKRNWIENGMSYYWSVFYMYLMKDRAQLWSPKDLYFIHCHFCGNYLVCWRTSSSKHIYRYIFEKDRDTNFLPKSYFLSDREKKELIPCRYIERSFH